MKATFLSFIPTSQSELSRFTSKEQSEECAFSGQIDFSRNGGDKNREKFFWRRKRRQNFWKSVVKDGPVWGFCYFCGRKQQQYDTNSKSLGLVMFNWVVPKGIATTRNIRDTMSRSKKKTPASTCCCCKSQKRGKRFCNRKFRRRERMMMGKGQYDRLPNKPIEVTDPWDLGGDGKTFWGFSPNEDWFVRLMRK